MGLTVFDFEQISTSCFVYCYSNLHSSLIHPFSWWLLITLISVSNVLQAHTRKNVTFKAPLLFMSYVVRFKVLTAVSMKVTVFWVVAASSLVEIHWHFRGAYCHHRPGDAVGTSETLVNFSHITVHKNPEDSHLRCYRCSLQGGITTSTEKLRCKVRVSGTFVRSDSDGESKDPHKTDFEDVELRCWGVNWPTDLHHRHE
jgi:hypothetical protein